MALELVARLGFAWVRWRSRHGLRETDEATGDVKKHEALQLGVRGETHAYWYLRRLGYIVVARNFMPARAKGELDLVGYDGDTLAIVDVRTRLATPEKPALPEMSIGKEKHEALPRSTSCENGTWHPARCGSMSWASTTFQGIRRLYGCTKPRFRPLSTHIVKVEEALGQST